MTNCDEIPLIEFLKAELNADETEELLRHVDKCVDCRERLQVMAAVAASYPERDAEKQHWTRSRTLWLIAAGIVVALIAPVLYMQLSPAAMGSLATSETYPAAFPLVTRGGVEVSALVQGRREAYEAYRGGDFQRSGALLKLLPRDAETLFYLGLSQYFSEEPEQSLDNFQRARELDPKWTQPACWYRASAYLKIGQKDRAKGELRELVKEDGEYRKKAEELLERLK